ncbi:SPOR domain-containing protein [Teredinibacter haidensis]|uniref:SPOR domain-containing protein n=1 Tax=Teredinibacter haidensis TaxID=2731755 RepID=UPI00094916D4|nr:SPOR domain-containing protein [Teredinibacter haidensis]
MDDGLRQRIVGAFVLVAIAVVFVPVVFDRERIEALDRKTQIPPAPHIEAVVVPAPVVPKVEEPLIEAKKMYVPDEKRAQAVEPEEPVMTAKGTPNSWVLQIASYKFKAHAVEKRDELIAQGYSAYIRKVKTERGNMHRLFVGPSLKKRKLAKAKSTLDKKLGVESILLKFEP